MKKLDHLNKLLQNHPNHINKRDLNSPNNTLFGIVRSKLSGPALRKVQTAHELNDSIKFLVRDALASLTKFGCRENYIMDLKIDMMNDYYELRIVGYTTKEDNELYKRLRILWWIKRIFNGLFGD